MSKPDIVFISGLSIPTVLAKTKYVWNDQMWEKYNRIYLSNYIPTSDSDALIKINNIKSFINKLNNPIVISQSLGAWWGAHLACTTDCKINKLILVTPLADTRKLYLFNTTSLLSPLKQIPKIKGPHKVLICQAKYDWVCPPADNSARLITHFSAMDYNMNGGHFFQKDHIAALNFMQEWIDI